MEACFVNKYMSVVYRISEKYMYGGTFWSKIHEDRNQALQKKHITK